MQHNDKRTPFTDSWKSRNARPLVIAGPCSAETESQVIESARELAKLPEVCLFRAGIWKPRTHPNTFEGVGKRGLKWLSRVKEETGLPVATEVANEKHVYEVLKHNIDVVWIGARTTVNTFAVQEIVDSLKGTDIKVFVKNPVNPDVDLWSGAIERFFEAGIEDVGAIHRGFSHYGSSIYRNNPNWQIPIELHRRFPNIPLLCDPSHISGKSDFLFEISQKAMDLDFDGLMIESHISPENALSDASQQITPLDLQTLLKRLVIRDSIPADPKVLDILNDLRKEIDNCDDAIIELLSERMKIIEQIGYYKKANKISILQRPRWEEIIKKSILKGEEKGLSQELIDTIFKALHQEAINLQEEIMK